MNKMNKKKIQCIFFTSRLTDNHWFLQLCLSQPPEDHSTWSLRTLDLTQRTVSSHSLFRYGDGNTRVSTCSVRVLEHMITSNEGPIWSHASSFFVLFFVFAPYARRLDSNPLICGCDTLWLSELLKRTPQTKSAATCAAPDRLRGTGLARLSPEDVNCCMYSSFSSFLFCFFFSGEPSSICPADPLDMILLILSHLFLWPESVA